MDPKGWDGTCGPLVGDGDMNNLGPLQPQAEASHEAAVLIACLSLLAEIGSHILTSR